MERSPVDSSPDPHLADAAVRRGIEALAARGDTESRLGLASSRSLPADLLQALAHDSSTTVQQAVAANPATPIDVLRALARSKGWPLPCTVAGNPSAPDDLLEELAESPSELVRTAVARNATAPDHVRARLALDPSETVRAAMREARGARADPTGAAPGESRESGSEIPAVVRAWVDEGRLPDGQALLGLFFGPRERLMLPATLLRDPRLRPRVVADVALADLSQHGPGWAGLPALGRILPLAVVERGLSRPAGHPPAIRAALGVLAPEGQVALALTSPDPAIRMGAAANRRVRSREQILALMGDPDADVVEVATARLEMALGRLGG
jgi:hypothetical protein